MSSKDAISRITFPKHYFQTWTTEDRVISCLHEGTLASYRANRYLSLSLSLSLWHFPDVTLYDDPASVKIGPVAWCRNEAIREGCSQHCWREWKLYEWIELHSLENTLYVWWEYGIILILTSRHITRFFPSRKLTDKSAWAATFFVYR